MTFPSSGGLLRGIGAAGAVAAMCSCASGDTNHPVGPVELVDVALQPARVPPNEQGALMLSVATGCYVEYAGKGATELVYRFRIGPTQRVPAIAACLSSLQAQPGVTGIQPAR